MAKVRPRSQPKFSPNQVSRPSAPAAGPLAGLLLLQPHGPARAAHQASQTQQRTLTQARESSFFLVCFSLAQACSLSPACMWACSSPSSYTRMHHFRSASLPMPFQPAIFCTNGRHSTCSQPMHARGSPDSRLPSSPAHAIIAWLLGLLSIDQACWFPPVHALCFT